MKTHCKCQTFAVTGITGKVGGVVARALLAAGHAVRAVVRSADKGSVWAKQGCQIALAEMNDAKALQAAFAGADGVFVLLPPNFAPAKGFPEATAIVAELNKALADAHPGLIVCLSTNGAQASRPNLLTQLQIMEKGLGRLPMPVAFLRAAWFMENAAWDVEPAMKTGVVQSFLQPLDKMFPMVATSDIGRVAAELLQAKWIGPKVVELEGPRRVTPNDIAATFSKVLGRSVKMEAVPREKWESLFKAQGMADPAPRIQMLDGFNEGWIEFEGGEAGSVKGRVPLETVFREARKAEYGNCNSEFRA
jgi:NAD(P)H dehydrogenase (quinone)